MTKPISHPLYHIPMIHLMAHTYRYFLMGHLIAHTHTTIGDKYQFGHLISYHILNQVQINIQLIINSPKI